MQRLTTEASLTTNNTVPVWFSAGFGSWRIVAEVTEATSVEQPGTGFPVVKLASARLGGCIHGP